MPSSETLWEPISMIEFLKVLKESRRLKCRICGKPTMLRYPSQIKDSRGKYCSKKCFHIGQKGKRVSPNSEFKRGQFLGEKHPKWKGGLTSESEKARKTREYKIWRTAVYKRDHYVCQMCGKKGGKLNAHHIKPFSIFPELRFAIDNGQTLCILCHRETESYGNKIYDYNKKAI